MAITAAGNDPGTIVNTSAEHGDL